ncbi:hypothetical protein [Pseudarthrobacter sp. PvP090]|uniref:hypothetical protein n=1 Tax=Pseudarthrobacter sp. PvP090 TaxID=3156393 RepID=UPI00339527D4
MTIWGADSVAMSVADTLADRGAAVLLVGPQGVIAPESGRRAKILTVPRLTANPRVRIRLGSTIEEYDGARVLISCEGLPPGGEWLVPLLQLCDGPTRRPSNGEGLVIESRSERAVPGEGDFDLAAVVAALPDGLPLSAETPSDRRVAELGGLGWARRLKSGLDAVLATATTLRETGNLQGAGHR